MNESSSGTSEQGVARLDGPAASGFIRMVRDGIEHGLLQLASEILDLTQQVLTLNGEQLRKLHRATGFNSIDGGLSEASKRLFSSVLEEPSGRRQLTEQLNSFKNDPANRRLSQIAAEMQVPTPTLDAATGGQDSSGRARQSSFLLTLFRHPSGRFRDDPASVFRELCGAYYAGMIITHAQGFALLAEASACNRFNLNLAHVAWLWNADRSERSELLACIAAAFEATPALPNLLCDENLSEKLMASQESLRHAVWRASELDILMPGMLASLDYLDAFKEAWLPVNLVPVRPVPIHDRWNWGKNIEADTLRP